MFSHQSQGPYELNVEDLRGHGRTSILNENDLGM
jgi:hypothetical protein